MEDRSGRKPVSRGETPEQPVGSGASEKPFRGLNFGQSLDEVTPVLVVILTLQADDGPDAGEAVDHDADQSDG
jgi:hypothetical protein